MTNEQKKESLEFLRTAYIDFMKVVSALSGSIIQKQQAFLRFDEGHMWMQNSIATYAEPTPEPEVISEEPVV